MASSLAVDPYKPRMVETMNRDQGREKQENGSPSQGKVGGVICTASCLHCRASIMH